MSDTPEVKTWSHRRKGRITGIVVSSDPTWLDIKLVSDHSLQAASVSSAGVTEAGEVITVRRSLLTEINPTDRNQS